MEKVKQLVLRADGNAQTGMGHMMRCLALGQAWKAVGGKVRFLTDCKNKSILKNIKAEGFQLDDRGNLRFLDSYDYLESLEPSWCVLDGYGFSVADQVTIKGDSRHKLLVVDDLASLKAYYADILVNPGPFSKELEDKYRFLGRSGMQVLSGLKYFMLREEFFHLESWGSPIPNKKRLNVLLTLGGADTGNLSLSIMKSLKLSEVDFSLTVLVGQLNPNYRSLKSEASRGSFHIRIVKSAEIVADWMAWADVAICGAGVTALELSYLGTPVLCIVMAGNQSPVAEYIARSGSGKVYNREGFADTSEAVRRLHFNLPYLHTLVSGQASTLVEKVDGYGQDRVVMKMLGNRLRLRPAVGGKDDCRFLFDLVSDPDVRESAIDTRPISWENHLPWFERLMSDSSRCQYIAVDEDEELVGQIRFERGYWGNAPVVDVDVSLVPEHRGKGLSSELISLGVDMHRQNIEETRKIKFHATVRSENVRSIKAFLSAGFKKVGERLAQGDVPVSDFTVMK